MQDHFKMVERFGFGDFEELLTTAEESMCETWITSTGVLALNISSWPMNPPRDRNLGPYVPPWLPALVLRIRPAVLRPIILLGRVLRPVYLRFVVFAMSVLAVPTWILLSVPVFVRVSMLVLVLALIPIAGLVPVPALGLTLLFIFVFALVCMLVVAYELMTK